MSTLSGNVSKGEKGKSKFQSLDINSLYRVSRGESLEQHQQKSTLPRKHGMQSLGKVPSARRAPANLPSLKSEHSGTDPAISLVPSGGSGWATTKDPATPTTNTTATAATTPSDTTTSNTPPAQCVTGPASAAAAPQHPALPGQQNTPQTQHPSDGSNKSSWSAIMSRPGDVGGPVVAAVIGYAGLVGGVRAGRGTALGLSFLAHQSPQFQHEFPSLSGQPSVSVSDQNQAQQISTMPVASPNAILAAAQQQSLLPQQQQPQACSHGHSEGGAAGPQQQQQSQQNRELNAQYGPGPSLRPQTEGSWFQGGSRTVGGTGAGAAGPASGSTPGAQGPPHIGLAGTPGHPEGPVGGRPNLGQSPGMVMAQGGPNGSSSGQTQLGSHQVPPNMQNYRGLIPPFMYRGNIPVGFPAQFTPNMGPGGPRPRFNYTPERFPHPQRQQERDRAVPPVEDEIITRPIIKEEDLTRMDDISRDAGWAAHDDIDYNQKLAFSDEETEAEMGKKDEKKEPKEEKREESPPEDREKPRENRDRDTRDRDTRDRDARDRDARDRDTRDRDTRDSRDQPPPHRNLNQGPSPSPRDFHAVNGPVPYPAQQQMRSPHPLKGVEEEEIWNQRRREQGEKVASAVERARQRKEEEEKRFQEAAKQAAAKKLQELNLKVKGKQVKQKDDNSGSSSESKLLISVPPVPIPVPEWERERENRERDNRDSRERDRSRTSSEGKDEKPSSRESRETRDSRESRNSRELREQPVSEFRQNAQIERTNFMRQQDASRNDRERNRDRDQREMRDREQPAFSRHFQNDMPPRFQKQQVERSSAGFNRVSPNSERPSSQPTSFSQQYDPGRWVHGNHPSNMSSSGMKQSHSMPPPQRRSRTDSELSGLAEVERPPSRDHRGPPRDDRYRHAPHRPYEGRKPGGYYEDYNRGYRDYEYEDRHSRDSWERDRHYDERDNREKKDYDNYPKSSVQQDPFDERDPPRERPESAEWRDDRRDLREDRAPQDRQSDSRREPPREERAERSERPQRPDSRDSRTSRESRTSLRDDDSHKSRDCGSWVNEISDYEEKKRDSYRDDNRDRRQPPGPVTREKIEADELKGEKRSLIQLKRTEPEVEKKESVKGSPTEVKKEAEVWNRKPERTPESSRTLERVDSSPKAWADAVSPASEKEEEEEEKMVHEPMNEDKEVAELKQSLEKLSVENKREETAIEEAKEESKDEKRDKNVRNRTNSGGSRGRETRGGRQWGGYSVYNRGWRGGESRGRRGGPRSMGRPGSARSGSYGRTDSELSGDEVSGSTESGKDERRSARSPKPAPKVEKDDRNREASRREDKRAEYSQSRGEKRGYEGRPSREGFAPSGEPSRRGRGGFRTRGATTGRRMEGYGPPPSKSPFSTERSAEEKEPSQQKPSTPTPDSEPTGAPSQSESADDKIMVMQQALTAGISVKHTKSANQQGQQSSNSKQEGNQAQSQNAAGQRNQGRKEDSRPKRNYSGNRRTQGREGRFRGNVSAVTKQNSSDVGNEDWETTSENSEEHIDERKESRSSRNKPFANRGSQGSNQNLSGSNQQSRRNDQPINNRDQRERSSNKSAGTGSRAPGAEKRNISQNATSYNNQRNHSGNIPPLMQNTQAQNGRPRSQGSANSGPLPGKAINKESTVNRLDEIKLNDPNLVSQALSDISKKSQGKEKKTTDGDSEMNNYSAGGDDGANSTEDKLDSDGFQEVRSKKNIKESRHSQKEEPKPPRREKEKDRERDRSKSKSNGPQPTPQQVQNIPPLLGQPIPQPANMPQKPFDRNPNRQKLAPRFVKQKLAKQQQQQQIGVNDINNVGKINSSYLKDASGGPAPPPPSNAWDKPFTSSLRSTSPSSVPADIQLMSGLTAQNDHSHDNNEQVNSGGSSQRNSPNIEKSAKAVKEAATEKNVPDSTSPPVQTLIFENTNYSKTTKTGPPDLAMKTKFSNHMKSQARAEKRGDMEDDGGQLQQHQQQALSAVFSSKPGDLIKDKAQEPIQMPLSFNKNEDNADMKLDFTFDSDLSQLTEDAKSKSLGMPRSIHMTGGQSTISPSTAELNLKIASVKKVWETAPPMPTVVEHEDGSVVSTASNFPQGFESADVDDGYSSHQQYSQGNMKNEITTSTNVCKLVPPQVKPQQQSSGSAGAQPGSTVPGPSPIGPGQSPIGHPPASLQGPLSPPPFNSTGQPSHINYQEFPQYPGSQAAQYGGMSAIPSPPAVLFNTGSAQLPAQAGGLYGAFQLDQSRSPFSQYPPYAPSLQNSFNQQSVYLQQPPPPPHAASAPPDMYQNNLSQYRMTAAAAPPFGQNQQLSNNPNTVLISSSSNSLMSASVKPSSQPIGAIGTKAPHFQAPSAPQPSQLAYIPYDPNQVLGVSGSYMGNSQLVQRQGPSVQPSTNSYYSATSADVFPGSQTGFYQPAGAAQQTGTHYGLQGFGQHSQSLATGSATPVNLQNFSSQFLSGSGLQMAAAAQQYRNPQSGLPGPANAAATFLGKHQQQEQPRQLKSPSGNQQDVLASVFSSTSQIPSPKSRNCKQQTSSQQPQPSPTQHHKYQQYQGVSQSALVLQQNVRGMQMQPRAGIQPSQQRYPSPIQRPVVPFPPGPNQSQQQQQQNCMPTQQQQQQAQMNRHRPNLHQQQQQQRNMKMQQQYYSGQGNVKMDSSDKGDSHNDKMSDGNNASQTGSNKANVNQQDSENKEEINQQNE